MLDSRGRLKLSDFGIAAQVSDSVSRVSMIHHGQSGTVTYMSPQQMDGKLPQVTDDIYALGATLYELLTSKPPFFTGGIAHQVRNLLPSPLESGWRNWGSRIRCPRPSRCSSWRAGRILQVPPLERGRPARRTARRILAFTTPARRSGVWFHAGGRDARAPAHAAFDRCPITFAASDSAGERP